MMVPWWLCLLAFFVGILFAGFVLAVMQSGRIADEIMEAERQKKAVEEQLERMRKAGW